METPTAPRQQLEAWLDALAVSLFLVVVLTAIYTSRFLFSGPLAVPAAWLLCRWLLGRRGRSWRDVGFRRPPRWAVTLRTAMLLTAILFVVNAVVGLGLQALGITPDLSAFQAVRTDLRAVALLLLVAWTTAAFGEEMIFRGFLLDRLRTGFGGGRGAVAAAVVLQAALFGLSHAYQGVGGMLLTGAVGLTLGVAVGSHPERLWAAILAHGLFDTVSIVLFALGVGSA